MKGEHGCFEAWFKKRHTKTGIYEKCLLSDDDALFLKHEMRKAYLAGASDKENVRIGATPSDSAEN